MINPLSPLNTGAPHSQSASRNQAWFRILKTSPTVRQRIFCLPHAGGSASLYRKWADALPADTELIAVQYPGREERLNEPCIDNMAELVSALIQSLLRQPHLLHQPYILFGHSMGAAVAYELCVRLQQHNQRLPCQLVVSASEGPGCIKVTALHQAKEQALLEEIVRLNADLTYLMQMPELTELILPSLKSDYTLIETYGAAPPSRHTVRTSVTAMVGLQDEEITLADVKAWAQISDHGFRLCSYPGGHFYLNEHYPSMIKVLVEILAKHSEQAWPSVP